MLELDLAGWFQCRLATDPDPADEGRGVSGWTFAVTHEPDLDRVIWFQDPPMRRSHGPDVGVTVREVRVFRQPQPGHPLAGAGVELLDGPRFEGRNGLVAEDGEELVDPFHLRVSAGGVTLRREDLHDPRRLPISEVRPEHLVRRLAKGVEGDADSVAEVQDATGIPDIRAHILERASALSVELQAAGDAATAAGLQKRLRGLRPLIPIRVSYDFGIGEFGGDVEVRDDDAAIGGEVDRQAPWPLRTWFGGFDADALCGFAKGTLEVPFR